MENILNINNLNLRNAEGWKIDLEKSIVKSDMEDTAMIVGFTSKLIEFVKSAGELAVQPAIIPLYNKVLIDVPDTRKHLKGYSFVSFEASEGLKINNIELENCAAVVSKFNKNRTMVSMVVIATEKDFKITIKEAEEKYFGNKPVNGKGNVFTITKNEMFDFKTAKEENVNMRIYTKSIIKKLIMMPKNALVTRFDRTTKNKVRKEGYITISIAQALSKNSIVISNSKLVEFDTMITDKDKEDFNNIKSLPLNTIYVYNK